MQMYYSPSKDGFYCREVHRDSMPEDAVEISDDLYAQLRGRHVVAGPDGFPTLYVEPAETRDQLLERAKADIRTQRQPIIAVLDGLQASALALGSAGEALAIEEAKDGLRDLTAVDLNACETYEQMRLAVKVRYAQIAKAAPESVRKAFSEALK